MNVIDLRRVDLNLLVVFQALMQEASVTRAAVKLKLSQSAVSAALARLRALFGDPLFERTRAGMVPTPRALAISARIGPTLTSIAGVIYEDPEFEPTRSDRIMHLAMSDDLELVLAPRLARLKLAERWRVEFAIHQTNSALWRESVENPRNDLTLTVTPRTQGADVLSEPFASGGYLCVYNPRLLRLSQPVTFEEYAALDHVRVSYDVQRGWVDDLLAARGHQRKILCAVSHFAGLVSILSTTPVIATIPEHAARALTELLDLELSPVPLHGPRFTISALWNARVDGTPQHLWLREVLQGLAAEV
ncbi:LysR family transcriptional regulator [Leucobacter allii]|uniref:LysR family transcriptional regulator n=1 Tax=Leucobacter allii TaxID=2932247 RepID=A0ABY4FIP0_9MICO|nr:LysR family transcriptional regulator [Leucobacter allii]UOQ55878.1 LysR family transcriptional regulator [Leucobacter allii]UOR00389.1 LysR family transcriptional regulator [Leucobacter allii]